MFVCLHKAFLSPTAFSALSRLLTQPFFRFNFCQAARKITRIRFKSA
jgi:hypothetical protein